MAGLGYNEAVESFRDQEYPMLKDSVYLDHAGSSLCSKSLMDAFAAQMTSALYGNPHSGSSSSQLSTARIEDIRLQLLSFFKADPADYDLVFVSNATAGVKLVMEGVRCLPDGYLFAYHQACHTSLVGVREEAIESVCLDDAKVHSWLDGGTPFKASESTGSATLFAYSAQSHMTGKRYPLSWAKKLKEKTSHGLRRPVTLLDAASLSATSQLDFSDPQFAPDFTVLSLYKIFGFPDLGVLIIHRSAADLFDNRKYFGGGTVDMVVCEEDHWHARKSRFLHERLEDGTLPFHNIMAIDIAIRNHQKLFKSMDRVSSHTSYLCRQLFQGLLDLHHGNGNPVCCMYSNPSSGELVSDTGPIISFNIRDSNGAWVSLVEIEKLAILKNVHIRTGGLCSPAGIASVLNLQSWEMRKNLSAGIRCGEDSHDFAVKPTGVIRVSLGAMSTKSDVSRFIEFVREFFVEKKSTPLSGGPHTAKLEPSLSSLQVRSITVYPIKSCGGFTVPEGTYWDVRPEGLAWDREWCLVHKGSGQALNQKRYPKMALLRPSLLLEHDILRIEYNGSNSNRLQTRIDIPLSTDPSLFDSDFRQTSSRVCGDNISAQSYRSNEINDFFSGILEVPCMLARFPPGGFGIGSRSSKARMQKHQQLELAPSVNVGSFPDMPSPPDSDSEQQTPEGRILLSNESPILMIHSSSLRALNKNIEDSGGYAVTEATFRANVVIGASPDDDPLPEYSEDMWRVLRIGDHNFRLLGACQRCQMVCVDQETGERKQEPFVTLAKTRRINGKVYFGAHMRHESRVQEKRLNVSQPTIRVGDPVVVDAQDSS